MSECEHDEVDLLAEEYTHTSGQECVPTRKGRWVRKGQGLGTDALCVLPHRQVDLVNKPEHYRWLPVEAIDITELFNFNLGNALKYIIRADHKGKPIEDLEKARWYLDRELQRRAKE